MYSPAGEVNNDTAASSGLEGGNERFLPQNNRLMLVLSELLCCTLQKDSAQL